MRRIARVDGNQADIVAALRAVGATVQPLHTVGKGCPDLLVGYRGVNHLLEVKNGSDVTDDQRQWIGTWCGMVTVVHSVDQALQSIGAKHG